MHNEHCAEVKVESVFRQFSDVKQLDQLGIGLIPAFGAHSESKFQNILWCVDNFLQVEVLNWAGIF